MFYFVGGGDKKKKTTEINLSLTDYTSFEESLECILKKTIKRK